MKLNKPKHKIVKKKVKLSRIACKSKIYRKKFAIEEDFLGVVTCPYCSEYVEG